MASDDVTTLTLDEVKQAISEAWSKCQEGSEPEEFQFDTADGITITVGVSTEDESYELPDCNLANADASNLKSWVPKTIIVTEGKKKIKGSVQIAKAAGDSQQAKLQCKTSERVFKFNVDIAPKPPKTKKK